MKSKVACTLDDESPSIHTQYHVRTFHEFRSGLWKFDFLLYRHRL
jgi:hypothetical protein